jgi:hypothetical protein
VNVLVDVLVDVSVDVLVDVSVDVLVDMLVDVSDVLEVFLTRLDSLAYGGLHKD